MGVWQHDDMSDSTTLLNQFDRRLIDGLYVEAMVLADEARSFFDHRAEEHRALLGQTDRVEFACESLKVTTRLMHVIAWLLTQRAIFNGELPVSVRGEDRYRLGEAASTQPSIVERFSFDMMTIIVASEDLYDRVARLERQLVGRAQGSTLVPLSPARDLLSRLERAF
jgi:regulator of CtrA degradation